MLMVRTALLLALAPHAHAVFRFRFRGDLDNSVPLPWQKTVAFEITDDSGLKDRQGNPMLNKRYIPFVGPPPFPPGFFRGQTLQEYKDSRARPSPPIDLNQLAEARYSLAATLKVRACMGRCC